MTALVTFRSITRSFRSTSRIVRACSVVKELIPRFYEPTAQVR